MCVDTRKMSQTNWQLSLISLFKAITAFSFKWRLSPQTAGPEQTSTATIEVVSVGDEDLPASDTPSTLNASALDSHNGSLAAENGANKVAFETNHTECQSEAPNDIQTQPCPAMPVTKVQPFLSGKKQEISIFKNKGPLLWQIQRFQYLTQ